MTYGINDLQGPAERQSELRISPRRLGREVLVHVRTLLFHLSAVGLYLVGACREYRQLAIALERRSPSAQGDEARQKADQFSQYAAPVTHRHIRRARRADPALSIEA